jgi:hypothetical protein
MTSVKVTAKVKDDYTDGKEGLLTKELMIVMSDSDSLEEILQMILGCWYELVDYTHEPIDVYVSETYVKDRAVDIIKRA